MRFKIDENLPVEVADLLRRHSHNALTVTEQQLKWPTRRAHPEQPLMGALWIVDERRVRIRGAEGA